MTFSAAARNTTFVDPADPVALLELARYRNWLNEAYHSTTSSTVRALITEVYRDLVSLDAVGAESLLEFNEAIVGALQSVIAAVNIDPVTS